MVNKNLRQIVNEQILNDLLLEAKSPEQVLDILVKKYISHYGSIQDEEGVRNAIKMVMDNDPTKKFSYTQWFISTYPKLYDLFQLFYPDGESLDELKRIFQFAKENNDFQLQTFKSVEDALNGIEFFKGKNEFEIIFNDNDWVVYEPHTYEAERYIVWHMYDGAKWCTASGEDGEYDGREMFERYTTYGKLWIFVRKSDEALFQLAPYDDEFRNADNELFDRDEIGLSDNILTFFDEVMGENLYDYIEDPNETDFYENAEEVGNTNVYLYNGALYTEYNDPLPSQQEDTYYNDANEFVWSNNGYVIVAPYTDGITWDVFAYNRGWAIKHEGVKIIEWLNGYDNFYGLVDGKFIYYEISRDITSVIAENIEKTVKIDSDYDIWELSDFDVQFMYYSPRLANYGEFYTKDTIKEHGLATLGDVLDLILDSGDLIDYGKALDGDYIKIKEDAFSEVKRILQKLHFLDVSVNKVEDGLLITDITENDEPQDYSTFVKELGDYLGLQYGIDNNGTPFLLVPSNASLEDKKRIHSYLRDDMDIKYKMMPSDDPSMLKLDVTPVSVYSVRECIKDKFNNMLKRING